MVELKEDRKLFSHLVVLCRSSPEINLKECIGKYELSVVPRSMFGSDGTTNFVQAKRRLMHHLEDIVSKELLVEVTRGTITKSSRISSASIFSCSCRWNGRNPYSEAYKGYPDSIRFGRFVLS